MKRRGEAVYLDARRRVLVPATPEEHVRQAVVRYLIRALGVPEDLIWTEESLAHWVDGSRDRVDVVVYDESSRRSFLVVECKAPRVPVTHRGFAQASRYQEVVGAPYMLVTNGHDSEWYQWRPRAKVYEWVEPPKSFEDMVRGEKLEPIRWAPPPRPAFGFTRGRLRSLRDERGAIGEGSPKDHLPFLLELSGLIHLESAAPRIRSVGDWTVRDAGTRYTTFNNHTGGSWAGWYRYFLLEDLQGDSSVVSVSMLGGIKAKNHPRYGNAPGHTFWCVAVDDEEQSHLSLQLDLDRYTRFGNGVAEIWHDGTLTMGRAGRVPREAVLTFIARRAPDLMRDREIRLGSVPTSRRISWRDASALLRNSLRYALLRDEFRAHRKAER